jgi:hypothetical protein
MIAPIVDMPKAAKTSNFLLYARCLFLMYDLFFSFGGQNYARYLTFFSVFLANIETDSNEALSGSSISL